MGLAALGLLLCSLATREWRQERQQRLRQVAEYRQRLGAALDALQAAQAANDQLAVEVREREQSIYTLLLRLNEANVKAARQGWGALQLRRERYRVQPEWFSRN